MKAVCTFNPPDEIKNDIQQSFPDTVFTFIKKRHFKTSDIKDAEILITFGEDLKNEDIDSAKDLKWIMVTSAGLEKMPWKAIKKRGIMITNARGIHKIPMAEFTFGYILQHEKQFRTIWEQQKKSEWNTHLPLQEVHGKTLMVAGAGAIGQEIARLAKAFGMHTLGMNSNGRETANFDEMYTAETMNEGLKKTDYLVSILPSTAQTTHFYKMEHFEAMKKTAVFINIGRGDAVEEKVLQTALDNGEIAHVFLDVFQEEPLPASHPFWKIENLTITPHISSHSQNYLPRAFEIFKHNLHTYSNKEGQFKNVVDQEKGY
ncbi:D-2-hydroxyacid dehydrogenase [Heyndrickxia acidicola]|uniref:D-2-hydroxyacid dehydrogenase n=1 Tax=Heyndrickxia acidicola TaxID=209389 RepID=A0ABU6MKY4_9BACI|nr:D-2-hydroxyacid dehydrogenase [Heyndrickxia acidicola]MED1204959.1 D-2-hydroxyacid dehydrogenase [Heyndrickxia acidicola]